MVALYIRSEPGALLVFLILSLWNLPLVVAGIVNRTIDDQFGDSDTFRQVTYLSTTSDVWRNQSCGGCLIQPDISRAFKGTYTAALNNTQLGSMNITMRFNGTAIYVFFILANNVGNGISSLTVANFTLDETNPELFLHAPDLTRTEVDYNQLVYSKQDLINAEHTLVIPTFGVNADVYVNFDYAIYTHDDDAPLLPVAPSSSPTSTLNPLTSASYFPALPDPKSSAPVGAIVGGVIGGVVFFLLVAFLLLFWRRRSASGYHKSEAERYVIPHMDQHVATVTPFNAQPTSVPFPSTSTNQRGYNKSSSGALAHQMSPSSQGDRKGGDIDPNANESAMNLPGSGPQYLNLNTLASADNRGGEEGTDLNSIEAIRRVRQNEIQDRLRAVQQEVAHLTSNLAGEMNIAEQLRATAEQIGHLRDQQRSAWAQGLSDDPPPGYTLNLDQRDSGLAAVAPPG